MKIMFVCHGNICRSPIAEFILRDLLQNEKTENGVEVFSSATSDEEIICGVGNEVYPPAKEILRRHGIDCSGKRAVRLKRDDYDRYDLFVGMDGANLRNMQKIFGGDPQHKIRRLLEYAGTTGDVADPWYSGDFETAYRDIYDGCKGLLERLKKLRSHCETK